MDDAVRMRESHGLADFLKDAQKIGQRARLLRVLIQPAALHEFHYVKNAAIRQLADVVYRHDARMLELRDDARFAQHAGRQVAGRVGRVQDFQSHLAPKLGIFREINRAHAAARKFFEQPVLRAVQIRQIRHVAQMRHEFV